MNKKLLSLLFILGTVATPTWAVDATTTTNKEIIIGECPICCDDITANNLKVYLCCKDKISCKSCFKKYTQQNNKCPFCRYDFEANQEKQLQEKINSPSVQEWLKSLVKEKAPKELKLSNEEIKYILSHTKTKDIFNETARCYAQTLPFKAHLLNINITLILGNTEDTIKQIITEHRTPSNTNRITRQTIGIATLLTAGTTYLLYKYIKR